MNGSQKEFLQVTLTFTPSGDIESVCLLADSDREEALLREALKPALKAYARRKRIRQALVWTSSYGALPRKITQRFFDLLRAIMA